MSPTAPPPVRQRPVPSRTPQRPNGRPASQRAHSRWGRKRRRPGFRLRSTGRRLRIAAAAMAVFFLLLAGRLVQLQGFQSHTYATLAEDQRRHTIDQPATRGEITDRSGNVLAVDVDANDVYANPHKVTDVLGEAAQLAPVLHKPLSEIVAGLLPNANFRYLALDVDTTVGDKVTKLNLPGIGTLPQRKRLYPAGNVASNVLGVVGRDGTGLAGLEFAYNTKLAGKNGTLVVEEDPQGRVIPSGTHREKSAVPGEGLQLTIDRDIQYDAEQELAAAVNASGAIKGVAIVMDPHTGAIYAMASAVNPKDPSSKIDPSLQNTPVSWTFEPGSVNKLITVSAAIDRHIVTPLTSIPVPGSPTPGIAVPDYVIKDAEPHPPENLTVAGVLAQSSNLGALLISRKLPSTSVLESELRSFGLGSMTGVGLPGESPGLLAPSSKWSVDQAATIPYGQGMSVNALQVADAYATIANGGLRVTPKVIAATINGKGKLEPTPAGPTRRVVSTQTAKTMQELLEQVTTSRLGTGAAASVPGYRVAGKTGTAARIDPATGRYAGYVASFVGFAPADKPSLVVLVTLDNPTSSIFGGSVAAPVFSKIMSFALTSLRIPPTGTQSVTIPQEAP